jgi:predicted Co/Zn/Cd cation transporter (cation efflux family)
MDIEIDFVVSAESEVHAIAEGDTVRQGLHEQFAAQGYESIVTLSADRWVA